VIGRFTLLMSFAASSLAAQQPDSVKCDSLLAKARVDTLPTGLFVSAQRSDGGLLSAAHQRSIVLNVGSAFVPPRPFRLSVFAGPALLRSLRSMSSDTAAELRSPTLTGIYRYVRAVGDSAPKINVIRESLLTGFDAAAVDAIRAASSIEGVLEPPVGEDRMAVDIRFSSDSATGAVRLVSANFPRIRVVDASPARGNPRPVYPESALADSLTGEVVLRFVVDRDGSPVIGTAEIIRATAYDFVRPALEALMVQHFRPATVQGCPVAQVVDYPFAFPVPGTSPH